MTGKEALDKLTKGIYCPPNCTNCDKCEKNESIKAIKKDLEVLEIIKSKKVDIPAIEFSLDKQEYNEVITHRYACGNISKCLTEHEYNKVKEWLENGKTN